MAEGEKKNVTVTRVSEQPPSKFGTGDKKKEAWKVETKEAGVIQVVLPEGSPKPKVGDNLLLTIYPPKEGTSYPPSGYPVRQGGGGGPRGKSPEEIRSIAAQTALIRATELCAAGKIPTGDILPKAREFYALLKELAA